ncbi:MAG: CvpA family protein [Candidatus Magasanikiibacteriota bacterium]
MGLFDVILLIIIGGFAMFGFWFGLIHTLGSLLGTVLGAYLASRYYEPMAVWLTNITGWESNVPKVLMFIIAFVIINRLVGFGFWIVDKMLSVLTNLPFIKGINRFLGLLLGFFEGAITIGLILYFIDIFPLSATIMNYIEDSIVAPYAIGMADILMPLLPDALKMIQSTIDNVENIIISTSTPI